MGDNPRERGIVKRIEAQTGHPGLYHALASSVPLSDLQSLLLAVYRQRARALHPSKVLRQYERSRFTQVASVDPREALRLDALAFQLLPAGYQAVELSPVCPLGSSSALAPVDQNSVVTTVRNLEVVSDSTNVLALECALRRKGSKERVPQPEVKLCASQRLLRAQHFEGPVSFAHFRLLSLCHSGRDNGNRAFETGAVVEHVDYYLRLLKAARAERWAIGTIRVRLIALADSLVETLESAIRPRLARSHPDVEFAIDHREAAPGEYYRDLRFNIHAAGHADQAYFLVDGGLTDWTQKLLNSRKERLMTSGMGTERLLVAFGPKATGADDVSLS